jgi:hypothetical protein
MQKMLKGLLVAATAAIMSTSAFAGGDSIPVYTSYNSAPVQIQMVEPAEYVWVPAVSVSCCYCCCGNEVSVGGFAFQTRAESHTLVVYQ